MPQLRQVYDNIKRADRYLCATPLKDFEYLDLLVLPEMAFVGKLVWKVTNFTPEAPVCLASRTANSSCTKSKVGYWRD